MARSHEAPTAGVTRGAARKPRGVVARSGGAFVRRVSTYVDLPTFKRLKARAGDTLTVSEVMGAALLAYLAPRRDGRARR